MFASSIEWVVAYVSNVEKSRIVEAEGLASGGGSTITIDIVSLLSFIHSTTSHDIG